MERNVVFGEDCIGDKAKAAISSLPAEGGGVAGTVLKNRCFPQPQYAGVQFSTGSVPATLPGPSSRVSEGIATRYKVLPGIWYDRHNTPLYLELDPSDLRLRHRIRKTAVSFQHSLLVYTYDKSCLAQYVILVCTGYYADRHVPYTKRCARSTILYHTGILGVAGTGRN